jgi:heme/copper-type cytochrome/quinol oxidase subunit 4
VGVILAVALILFAIPVFLAWDHALGSGRSVWTWMFLALVTSWMVLPIMWLMPRKDEG